MKKLMALAFSVLTLTVVAPASAAAPWYPGGDDCSYGNRPCAVLAD